MIRRPPTLRLLVAALLVAAVGRPLAAQMPEGALPNDNRAPAGKLQGGVLAVTLELRKGVWHPEGEDGEAIPIYGLAEPGKPLQVPAPLIRVPEGTTVELSIRSAIPVPTTFYGLHQRPGSARDVVVLEPGKTQQVRFEAGAPGTYLYYGRTPDGAKGNGRGLDAMRASGETPKGVQIFQSVGAGPELSVFDVVTHGGA